jgi:hypothetical protein
MDPALLRGVEEEMDKRPDGTTHPLYGHYDTGLRELMLLLLEEAEVGGIHGKIYVDSLSTALATRLIFVGRSARQPQISKVSSLPRGIFLRVVERMRLDLSTSLTLGALAEESGIAGPISCVCLGLPQDGRLIATCWRSAWLRHMT